MLAGELNGVEKTPEDNRIGLVRFVEGEQHRIAILVQPVRQPEYRIGGSVRSDLERDARDTGLQADGEIVELAGCLSDGAANALEQGFG